MKILKLGSVGPSVELLQLALGRAGARSLAPDGIFGNATKAALRTFQSDNGLAADGVAGPATHRALMPYYTGFASHRIHRGDTLFALSQLYNVPLSAILRQIPASLRKSSPSEARSSFRSRLILCPQISVLHPRSFPIACAA